MNLSNIFNFDEMTTKVAFSTELLKINEEIQKYGLELTLEDMTQIISVRNRVLKNYGRLELSFGVTEQLIKVFSPSEFINDKNYVETLNDLQETFYYFKNETEEGISDDKLIAIMKDKFDNSCGGVIEKLNSMLEEFSRDFREKLG